MSATFGYTHAHFYDRAPGRASADQPAVRCFLRHAREAGGALEIGAGTGRVALLVKAAARPEVQPHLTVLPGEAATFDLGRRVPFAYATGVLQHFLRDEDLLDAFRNVARHLEPGGRFLCDNITASGIARDIPPTPLAERRIGELTYRSGFTLRARSGLYYHFLANYQTLRGDAVIEESGSTPTTTARPTPRGTSGRSWRRGAGDSGPAIVAPGRCANCDSDYVRFRTLFLTGRLNKPCRAMSGIVPSDRRRPAAPGGDGGPAGRTGGRR